MISFKKLAAAAASCSLAASMFGCSASIGNGTQKALSADGYDVRSGVFIYYTLQAYDEAVSVLSEQNNNETPTLKDVKGAHIDELDASEWIQDKATENCTAFAATKKEFDNIGGKLSKEDLDQAAEMAEYYLSYDPRNEANGVGIESMKEIAENTYKEQAIFEHYYGIDAPNGCSEDELKDYFDENFARVKYFSISLTDSEGNEMNEDDKRKMHQKAEEYAKKINKKSGDLEKMLEFDVVNEEYNDYVAAQTTAAEGETPVETTTTAVSTETDESGKVVTTTTNPYEKERLMQKQTTTTAEANADPTVTTTAETETSKQSRQFNEYVFNELTEYKAEVYDYSPDTIYVVIKGDLRERMTEDDYWTDDYKLQLLQTRYYDEFIKMMEGIADKMSVEKNSASYRRYSPFKLELESSK